MIFVKQEKVFGNFQTPSLVLSLKRNFLTSKSSVSLKLSIYVECSMNCCRTFTINPFYCFPNYFIE